MVFNFVDYFTLIERIMEFQAMFGSITKIIQGNIERFLNL